MVLKGKIIKILDDKRVIVNLGHKDGVKKDMKFFIFSEGEEIIDPETKKTLGKRDIVKHRIKVRHIQETFSIMESDQYYRTTLDMLFNTSFVRQEPFKLDENIKKTDEDMIVRIGDLVREDIG